MQSKYSLKVGDLKSFLRILLVEVRDLKRFLRILIVVVAWSLLESGKY
jgi:hypothetical protein